MLESGELDRLAKDLWDKKDILPQALFDCTPHQIEALFASSRGRSDGSDRMADRIGLLTLANDERGRKGLPPIIPSWL